MRRVGKIPTRRCYAPRIIRVRSDGLYFGEGSFAVLQADDMAGPILAKAAQLLQAVVTPLVE